MKDKHHCDDDFGNILDAELDADFKDIVGMKSKKIKSFDIDLSMWFLLNKSD